MKVISIWNPFAALVVRGCKTFETRSWSPPTSLIGQKIGIASTKTIRPEQRAYFTDNEVFMGFYEALCFEEKRVEDFANGFLLGTVILDSVELITEEFLDEVSFEEIAYGWWLDGFYAWRLTDPVEFENPIPIRGKQGIYDWHGDTQGEPAQRKKIDPQREAHLRRRLLPSGWA